MGGELSSIISNRNQELISSVDDSKFSALVNHIFDEDGEIMTAIYATVSWCRLMDLVCGGGGRGYCCYECIAFYHTECVCLSWSRGLWVVGEIIVVHVKHLHVRNFWDFSFLLSHTFSFVCPFAGRSSLVGWISPFHLISPLFFLFFVLAS